MSAAEDPTDPIRKKLVSREHHIGLDRLALAPWTHLGSIALRNGLFLGTKQGTMRTPWPPFLTSSWRRRIGSAASAHDECELGCSKRGSTRFRPRSPRPTQSRFRQGVSAA